MEQKSTIEGHDELGIVSVNKRTGTPGQTAGKLVFLVVVGSVMVIGLLVGMNQWHASRTAEAAQEEQAAKVENKPAQVGPKRVFDSDSSISLAKFPRQLASAHLLRPPSLPGTVVPGLDHGPNEMGGPVPRGMGTGGGRQTGTARASRFAGDAILANTHASTTPATQHRQDAGAEAAITLVRDLLGTSRGSQSMAPAGSMVGEAEAIPVEDESSLGVDSGQAEPGGDPCTHALATGCSTHGQATRKNGAPSPERVHPYRPMTVRVVAMTNEARRP